MNNITVYTKDNCMQCNMTKKLLTKQGVDFEVINIDHSPEWLEVLKDLGYKSVPITMVNGEVVAIGFNPNQLKCIKKD